MYVRVGCVIVSALASFSSLFASEVRAAQETAKLEQKIAKAEKKLAAEKQHLATMKRQLVRSRNQKTAPTKKVCGHAKSTSHWAGSNVQLGLVRNTGNTQSTNFTGGAKIIYKNHSWSNTADLQMQLERSQGEVTKKRYYGADELKYSFSKKRKSFVYSTVNVTEDAFSPYVLQVTSSAGYGRDFIKTDKLTWNLQAGPGVRYGDVRAQQHDNYNFIVYTASNLIWKINSNMNFSQQVQYTFGHPYNYLQSVSALTNKLTGNLALQVSYTLQYYSQIPLGSTNTEKLDTVTNLALVYTF